MAEQQVNKVTTPISDAEMSRVFLDVAKKLFNVSLSKEQLAIIIAQNNLETGNRKYMHNYNIGNIMHVAGDGHDFFVGGDKTKNNKGEWVPFKAKFRSYPNLEEAAKDYLGNLKRRGGGTVWNAIMSADPAAFAKALKQTKYYEADEKDYAAGMHSHFKAYNKSDSYDKAVANNYEKAKPIDTGTAPATSSEQPATQPKSFVPDPNFGATPVAPPSNILSRLDQVLNSFIKALGEEESHNNFEKKALYKNNLLEHQVLIKINSDKLEDSIEFARILCTALDEELQAYAYTHTNKNDVEVECTIYGPKSLCIGSILQLCDALSDTFEMATKKIGGCQIKSIICPNKKSDYQELDMRLAQIYYNAFHLKFINGTK